MNLYAHHEALALLNLPADTDLSDLSAIEDRLEEELFSIRQSFFTRPWLPLTFSQAQRKASILVRIAQSFEISFAPVAQPTFQSPSGFSAWKHVVEFQSAAKLAISRCQTPQELLTVLPAIESGMILTGKWIVEFVGSRINAANNTAQHVLKEDPMALHQAFTKLEHGEILENLSEDERAQTFSALQRAYKWKEHSPKI